VDSSSIFDIDESWLELVGEEELLDSTSALELELI
jgi:hypothetical protein